MIDAAQSLPHYRLIPSPASPAPHAIQEPAAPKYLFELALCQEPVDTQTPEIMLLGASQNLLQLIAKSAV